MNAWFPFLFALVLQLTVITIIGAAAMEIVRRNAALRHAIGVAALALTLASPVTAWLLPQGPWRPWAKAIANSAEPSLRRTARRVAPNPAMRSGIRHEQYEPQPTIGASEMASFEVRQAVEFGRPIGQPLLVPLIASVWIVGAAVQFLRRVRWRSQIDALRRTLAPAGVDAEVVDCARRRVGLPTAPPIYVSASAPMPLVLGCRGPLVVLPARFLEAAKSAQLRDVLTHEFAHVARHDAWVNVAQQLALILYWFHPGVYWLHRQLLHVREEACDNFVLRSADPVEYSESLLELAERYGRDQLNAAAIGFFASRGSLERRVTGILDPARRRVTRIPKWETAAVALLLIALSAFIGGSALRAQDKPPANSDTAADEKVVDAVRTETQRATPAIPPAQRVRADTPAGKLLDKLEQQHRDGEHFKDPWLQTLRSLVELGPEATPDLVAELDATKSDMMMRCCGFAMRGIGDPRAVPALIRAIPKTVVDIQKEPSFGNDMVERADDPALAKWAQTYEIKPGTGFGEKMYGFGRPIREIPSALQKLTSHDMEDIGLCYVGISGTSHQRDLQLFLVHQHARRWATWWEAHAAEFVHEEAYLHVNLPEQAAPNKHVLDADQAFRSGQPIGNHILSPIRDQDGFFGFIDLDSQRIGHLPEKWRKQENLAPLMPEIRAWAASEGFDVLGTEYVAPEGTRTYAMQGIDLQAWELDDSQWKRFIDRTTMDDLKRQGTAVGEYLLHFDSGRQKYDPEERATIFYVTREGMPGMLYVGVEVRNNLMGPADIGKRDDPHADDELNPRGFCEGRRFGMQWFEEAE